jgi:hypothetical protein
LPKTSDNGDDVVCNENHGIIKILTLIPELNTTKLECKSVILPHVYTDQDTIVEGFCTNGEFEIDLLHEEYSSDKCKCTEEKLLITSDIGLPGCVNIDHLNPTIEFYEDSNFYNKNLSKISLIEDAYVSRTKTGKHLHPFELGISDVDDFEYPYY